MLFVFKFSIHIANQVIAEVVTDVQLFESSKLAQLFKHFFVEVFKVFIDLLLVKHRRVAILRNDLRNRVLIHVAHEDRLTEHGLVMQTRAAVAVAARTDLEVERAVHTVFFRAVNAREVFRATTALFATATSSTSHAVAIAAASSVVPSSIVVPVASVSAAVAAAAPVIVTTATTVSTAHASLLPKHHLAGLLVERESATGEKRKISGTWAAIETCRNLQNTSAFVKTKA